MDIGINSVEGKFKFRVCGILEHHGKYLAVKMNDNKFFCLPGGHVELGEDTEMAVQREMREELGYEIKIKKLVSINQNFFVGVDKRQFHEIGYYYIVNAVDEKNINTNNYVREELDKGKIQHLEFKWFTKEELKQIDFRPKYIVDCFDKTEPTLKITRD